MNIADTIADHARTRAQHPAIEDGERIVSYSALNKLIRTCAANLHDVGIRRDDIVGVLLPDSAEHIAILYALARLGAVSLSIDGQWGSREREQAVAGLGIRSVIAGPGAARLPDATMLDVRDLVCCTTSAAAAPKEVNSSLPPDGSAPAMVVQSSGTTGAPKHLVWTHADIRERGLVQAAFLGLTSTDRYLQIVSISFLAGRRRCIMMHWLGATVVLNRARTTKQFLACFTEQKITFTYLTPAHLQSFLARSNTAAPIEPAMKILVSSAPVKHEQRLLARERLTPNLFESYGTNEVGDLAFASPEDQDAYPESVGRVIEGIEAEIVDDKDTPLATGEVGFVRFRGAKFPTGYLNDPDSTTRSFRNGWFYPGDLATLNDEGYLFFKGRADDVINNEGAKFYPIEVENALLAHPAVTEAAVLGWPHERFGEVAVAFVVAGSPVTAKDLAAFCRQQISAYKSPYRIFFTPELPRNRMGKIVKRQLRERLAKNPTPHGRLA